MRRRPRARLPARAAELRRAGAVPLVGNLDHPATLARLAGLADVEELHLGFDVLARAVFLGLGAAVAATRGELLAARALLAPGAGAGA